MVIDMHKLSSLLELHRGP